VPAADKGKLDITELDIKPKKLYIKGTAENAAMVGELADDLGKIDCFEHIEKGKISQVTAHPSGDNPNNDPPRELRQFDLTITTTCQ
jgi:hypothetical protein